MSDSDSNRPDLPEPSISLSGTGSESSTPAGMPEPPRNTSSSAEPPRSRPKRDGMSPLAWVLLVSSAFFVCFLVISGVLFFGKGVGGGAGRPAAGQLFSTGAVGVIEMNGVIMDSKKTLRKLEELDEAPQIKAVVLRLNSPGGSVAPSQEIYQAVKHYKKPIVVSMGSVAASGAYYIAMGAKKVYANPGTITGSIGVIMEFANLEKLYEWAKIQRYSIKTGKYKDAGAEYREMSPEERALLQGMIDDVLLQFKQAVADGRKLSMEQVTEVADGRIFSGAQAKAAKLVDELGTLQDAIDEAAKMAGIKGKPEVIYAEKARRRWLDLLMEDPSREDGASESAGILQSLAQILNGRAEKALTGLEPGVYWLWHGAR